MLPPAGGLRISTEPLDFPVDGVDQRLHLG
jgi:hypothetical protein